MRAAALLLIVMFSSTGMQPEGQRSPVGVGEVRFANSGSPAAQECFLIGLAQLHNFEYPSAATLFRKAQQIDPHFAMAYWGEAMTYNHPVWMEQDLGAARKVLERLGPSSDARVAAAPTRREQDYIRAVNVLYGAGSKDDRDRAYADAMGDLARTYPDDPDAAALYALSLLGTAHEGRDFAIYMRAAAIVEPVFRDHPNHPGAAHYLIHSYDDPVHAPLGLRAALAYSKIAPAAGHAQHMTSHIFLALGRWNDVVEANEAAIRVVNSSRAERGQPASACGHYNFWLEYGYLQQRRFSSARKLLASCYEVARRAASTPGSSDGRQLLDPDNSPGGSFAAMRLRYLLDTEEWSSEPAAWIVDAGGQWRTQIAIEFGTGFAAARAGRLADAAAALQRLSQAREALGRTATAANEERDAVLAREWARILEGQLTATLHLAGKRTDEALPGLQDLAAAEEKLPFEFGPPAIDKPSHELVGEALLELGRPLEARVAFEKALARAPERTASLVGLMRSACKSGDAGTAAATRRRLREIWRSADRLPEGFDR